MIIQSPSIAHLINCMLCVLFSMIGLIVLVVVELKNRVVPQEKELFAAGNMTVAVCLVMVW
jgi:hypothetical protein